MLRGSSSRKEASCGAFPSNAQLTFCSCTEQTNTYTVRLARQERKQTTDEGDAEAGPLLGARPVEEVHGPAAVVAVGAAVEASGGQSRSSRRSPWHHTVRNLPSRKALQARASAVEAMDNQKAASLAAQKSEAAERVASAAFEEERTFEVGAGDAPALPSTEEPWA